jgi:hypothetical protein
MGQREASKVYPHEYDHSIHFNEALQRGPDCIRSLAFNQRRRERADG